MKQSKNSSTKVIVLFDVQWYMRQSKTSLWCKNKPIMYIGWLVFTLVE